MALTKQDVVREYLADTISASDGLDQLVTLLLATKTQQTATLKAWLQARRAALQTRIDSADAAAATIKTSYQTQASETDAVLAQL